MLFTGGNPPVATKSRSHAREELTCTSFTQGYCYRNSSTTLTGSMEKRNNINTRTMNLLKRTFKVTVGPGCSTLAGIRGTQEQGTCWSVTKSGYLNLIVLGRVLSTQVPKQVTKTEYLNLIVLGRASSAQVTKNVDRNTIIGKQQLLGLLISRVLTKVDKRVQARSRDGISQYIRL